MAATKRILSEQELRLFMQKHMITIIRSSTSTPSRGIVILGGWYNSKPRPLGKYASLYANIGFDVVQISTDSRYPIESYRGYDERLRAMLQLAEQVQSSPTSPIMFHSLSMGGLKYLTTFLHLSSQQDSDLARWRERIRGCVVDSAPGYLNPVTLARGVSYHLPARTFGRFFMFLGGLVFGTLQGIPRVLWTRQSVYTLFGLPLLWTDPLCRRLPFLFIYSQADRVCAAAAIESAIAKIKQNAQDEKNIQTLFFQNSGHVQHLVTYAEPYKKAIEQFIDQIVEKQ